MAPANAPLDPDILLPKVGTRFVEVTSQLDGPSRTLGDRFVAFLRPSLEAAGLWRPGRLQGIAYTDRYVRSPFIAYLLVCAASRFAAKLSSGLPVPLRLTTAPLKPQDGAPHRLHHDWRLEDDRDRVLHEVGRRAGLEVQVAVGPCPHSRRLTLEYDGGAAVIVLDQGWGFLRPTQSPPFDFRGAASAQASKLASMNVLCAAEGSTYVVIVDGDARFPIKGSAVTDSV